jgi:DNA-binding transcriptional MerR regulator
LIFLSGYTVKQVAKLSGVSVRTLHHYDEIGLLKPDSVGANGYRYYGRDELLRLQQILFHRELGFPLDQIRQVLDAPDFDRVAALKAHRTKLEAAARRNRRLVKTIDETLAALQGATTMDDKGIYKGFPPEKQAEYEAWLVDRYGDGMRERIEESKRKLATIPSAEIEAMGQEGKSVEDDLVKAFGQALPADSAAVQALMKRHHAWVSHAWSRPAPAEAFANLGRMYLDHPDMKARYEGKAAGLTEWLAEAMRVFAETAL